MKKATITFITSVALACTMPLYAADKSSEIYDPEQKPGVAQQRMKSDSEQKAGATQPGMKSGAGQKTGIAQQSEIYDPEKAAGVAQRQTGAMASGHMMTAEKLKGMEVVSQEGEEIGEIKTVMLDKRSGEVQFITFSKGGEDVAVPLSAFEFGEGKARLTVDQSKLENVPRQTAEATDSDYLRDLEAHYGVAPAWGGKELGDPVRDPASGSKPY